MSCREQEGVRHAAADRERVDACEQRTQHVDLAAHLRAADDREERPRWCAHQTAEGQKLLLQQQSRVGGEDLRDALRRGMRAVRSAEGIVYIEVIAARERLRERGIVLL